MIRVVLDTNIVVSALLRSKGLPHAIFNLAANRLVQLCISKPILAEYREVASRPRLKIAPAKLKVALAQIRSAGLLVAPKIRVTAVIDLREFAASMGYALVAARIKTAEPEQVIAARLGRRTCTRRHLV